jgi:surfeit locus 1 family protein
MLSFTRAGIAASIAVMLIALLCARLGFWQLHRLEQKRTRNTAAAMRMKQQPVKLSSMHADTNGLTYRKAVLSGTYDDSRAVIVAGRSLGGVPGVYVLTPMRVGNTGIMVNRGWLPSADAASVDLQQIRESNADSVTGLIVPLSQDPRVERDTNVVFRRVWYHLNHAQLQRQFPYPLANFALQLLPARDAPQFPKRLGLPEFGEGPHLSYAVQWFSFALIALIGWLILILRK